MRPLARPRGLEAHHYNQQEVESRSYDQRTDHGFGVVIHGDSLVVDYWDTGQLALEVVAGFPVGEEFALHSTGVVDTLPHQHDGVVGLLRNDVPLQAGFDGFVHVILQRGKRPGACAPGFRLRLDQ